MRSNAANNADQSLDEVELLMPEGIEESWKYVLFFLILMFRKY